MLRKFQQPYSSDILSSRYFEKVICLHVDGFYKCYEKLPKNRVKKLKFAVYEIFIKSIFFFFKFGHKSKNNDARQMIFLPNINMIIIQTLKKFRKHFTIFKLYIGLLNYREYLVFLNSIRF